MEPWILNKHVLHFLHLQFGLCHDPPTSASLTTLKPLTVWIMTNCGKFLNRWEYQTLVLLTRYYLPASCETCLQVKKQQLELDMEQETGSKLGKEYVKAVYCHPAHFTYM